MYKNYDSKKLGITVSRAAVLDETKKAIWMVTNRSSFLLKVDLITNETFGSNSIFVILTDFKEKIRNQKEDKSVEFKYYINFKDLEFYPYWKR